MPESIIHKFKRGARNAAATVKAVTEKAKKSALEGEAGWNTLKSSYNAKVGQPAMYTRPTI